MFTARGSKWHGLSSCPGLVRRLVFLAHRRRTLLGPGPHRDISVQQGKARCNSDQLWHHSFVDQRLQLFTVSLLLFIIHLGPLLTRLLQDSTQMNTLDPNQIRDCVLFRPQHLAHPPPCPPFPIPSWPILSQRVCVSRWSVAALALILQIRSRVELKPVRWLSVVRLSYSRI